MLISFNRIKFDDAKKKEKNDSTWVNQMPNIPIVEYVTVEWSSHLNIERVLSHH